MFLARKRKWKSGLLNRILAGKAMLRSASRIGFSQMNHQALNAVKLQQT